MPEPELDRATPNLDPETVDGFGEEWDRYDQSVLSPEELNSTFERYFEVFPWARLPEAAVGFDLGCGSGRWARCVAPRVGRLHCIDASEKALMTAKRNLQDLPNCEFHLASVDSLPLVDSSMDFGYSLGVLHHVPDTEAGIRACVAKLKPGAPFLVYLYYSFDNRPRWFRSLWELSDKLRRRIAVLPTRSKIRVTELIAAVIYFPLARLSGLIERLGVDVGSFPLSIYRHHSFYTMRTDALDRFGTRLEQRFSRSEMQIAMERAGLVDVSFRDGEPYWCAVGYRGLNQADTISSATS
jgi:SAM-dependent methyltransferase